MGGLNFDYTENFRDGRARVCKFNKWGYFNLNGKLLQGGLQWDQAGEFINRYAEVVKNGVTYYINTKGECVENCP